MRIILTAVTCLLSIVCSFAQSIQSNALFTPTNPNRDFAAYTLEADYLEINDDALQLINETKPNTLTLQIPSKDGNMTLELTTNTVMTADCKIKSNDSKNVAYTPGLHYKGTVSNSTSKSLVAISIFKDYIMGVISINGENYVLGHLYQDRFPASKQYVFYKESDLTISNNITCGTDALPHTNQIAKDIKNGANKSMNVGGVVRVYVEADNTMYTNNGSSTTNTTNYITGVWNVVSTLYNNEQITTVISELFIWTTADTYSSSSSGTALDEFATALNGNFNGDLAHLFSADGSGGGVAWLDQLCGGLPYAYSGSLGAYNGYPTYSWTIEVITHEMGHNLGSPHTHDCSWGPNSNQKLDTCGDDAGYSSGTCTTVSNPPSGGTIMSYCHLTGTGIQFTNGFGVEPGNLIRARVLAATCLDSPNLPCNTATAIACGQTVSGTTVGTTNGVTTYSCGAESYTGGEKIYTFSPQAGSDVTVTLTSSNSNLRAILASGCSETTCINTGTSFTTAGMTGGTYYIIVDGLNAANATFTLLVNCVFTCNAINGTTSWEYIDNVSMSEINNTSGNNNGSANFSAQSANGVQGSSIGFSLTPGFSSTPYNEYWGVWIDYNNDGDYFDANETVYTSAAATQTTQSGSFIVPANATVGAKPMRVTMKFQGVPSSCETAYYEGETELYTFNVISTCAAPLSANSFPQSATSQFLYWPKQLGAIKYQLRYRQVGTTTYTTTNVVTAYKLLSGLLANTNYEYNVRTQCPSGWTGWSNVFTFSTTPSGTCGAPTLSYSTIVSSTSARVFYSKMIGSTKYQIRYRLQGATTYLYKNTVAVNVTLTALSAGGAYEYNVRGYCSGAWTAWGSLGTFYLPATTALAMANDTDDQKGFPFEVNVYPNPAKEELTLQVTDNRYCTYQIMNLNGQIIIDGGAINEATNVNIRSLKAGMYIATLRDADGNIQAKRFVVSE